ncbi:hypothetical protein A5706_22100 [Mycobacterium sp. E796]|nr:hypothetical protein A5706_22100 [Mycobacterium sp. E796]
MAPVAAAIPAAVAIPAAGSTPATVAGPSAVTAATRPVPATVAAAAPAAAAVAASATAARLERQVGTAVWPGHFKTGSRGGRRDGVRSRVTAEEDGPSQQACSRDTDHDPTDQAQ